MTVRENRVAVLGASGVVGRAAVRMLARLGLTELRVGARDTARIVAGAGSAADSIVVPPGTEVCRVDAYDPDSLAEFCAGTRLVLNCAGPSYLLLDRVARAALAAGSNYVDVSGDAPAYWLLEGSPLLRGGRVAVLGAGMLPGLANVVPRLLAGDLTGARLVVYAGGIESFSPASAADLALSVDSSDGAGAGGGHWYGEALAAWSGGRRRRNALPIGEDVEVAGFPGRVTTMPFLTADAERLARSAGLRELHWHNVFLGSALRLVLTRIRGQVRGPGPDSANGEVAGAGTASGQVSAPAIPSGEPESLPSVVAEIRAAAELDLAGLDPFYLMAFTLSGPDRTDTAVLRTPSSFALTAATAAHAVTAVLAGSVPPGQHYADEVLDPHALMNTVVGLGALPVWHTHAHAYDEEMEMGSL